MSLKQIHATEQIMRIAINGQNHVDSLIGYYRDCIDKFNDERAQWAMYYEVCKQNVSNKHLIQRELKQINSRKVDLENQLSGLKGELTYERQKYFQKIQQNQRIKDVLQQNKKRLRQLTDVCKPLGKVQSSIPKSSHSSKTYPNQSQQKKLFKNQKISQTEVQTEVQLKLINQNKQYQDKKQKIQSKVDQLKQQLEELVSEHNSRGQQCSQQYKQSLNRLSDLQSKHQNLISEFFKYRMIGVQDEQKLQQENQVIRLKNLALAQRLRQLQDSHSEQFKSVEAEVKRKNKQFKQKYDQQLQKKQEHLSILKQQNQRISDIYLNKLKKLELQLRQTTQKAKKIQQKTKVQVSSLKSQIKILTNRLQNVAMNQMRSDLVPNNEEESQQDSSVTLQMQQLDRINKEVKDLQKQMDKKNDK